VIDVTLAFDICRCSGPDRGGEPPGRDALAHRFDLQAFLQMWSADRRRRF
jgi:hypothetical protein